MRYMFVTLSRNETCMGILNDEALKITKVVNLFLECLCQSDLFAIKTQLLSVVHF